MSDPTHLPPQPPVLQPAAAHTLHGLALLPQLGVIRAEGEEAAKFLHNQLTQDFALLGLSEARLCALCSAKGRMLASFIGFKRSATEILLVCQRDLLAATLKRLSMFVLRTKVKLTDASADTQIAGLVGKALDAFAPASSPALSPAAHNAWSLQALGEASLVMLYPAAGQARALWLAPASVPLPQPETLSAEQWQWTEVHSGIAMVSTPTVEAFVPQMLNYESVGGVSFKKGCYPGQEVVARSQFRGTLKRRAYLVQVEAADAAESATAAGAALTAGQEVFSTADPEQPTGLVAQAAANPAGGWDAIISIQVAQAGAELHAGSVQGPRLHLLPLPYALLEDL